MELLPGQRTAVRDATRPRSLSSDISCLHDIIVPLSEVIVGEIEGKHIRAERSTSVCLVEPTKCVYCLRCDVNGGAAASGP